MDEFDRLGRDEFLKKHGFARANRYFVKRNGRLYDSKAIYGVAHQIQFPEEGPKRSSDFSGGERHVQGPLEALGFEFEATPIPESETHDDWSKPIISTEDIRMVASSRSKQRYAELSADERAAYVNISTSLERLGNLLKSKLANPSKYEVRTTSGFNVTSGVRSFIPKDLWFSVSPKENSKDLAAIPQMFMIVSERGIEYGFGASVSPADFSQKAPKDAVRSAAPRIFDRLPVPNSDEAKAIAHDLIENPPWYFRTKHRLAPNETEFSNLQEWFSYLKSDRGKAKAAGAISRYLIGDEVDEVDLSEEVATMARVFEQLLDRNWQAGYAVEPSFQDEAAQGDLNKEQAWKTDAVESAVVAELTDEQPCEPYSIEDALRKLFLEREDVERHLETWRSKKNLILTGAPGVGKSFIARRLAYCLIGYRDDHKVQTVQFHQSYSYEDFVQGYRPNGNQGFERKNGTFYEFRDRALKDSGGTYVFIIDEINRGNLSKIFGELMLLIESDKRGPTWKTRLAYAANGDEDFYVPDNLFILGMMNTADRSLSVVDYALRRRFAFVAMQPLFGTDKFRRHLGSHGIPEEVINKIVSGMGELNQAIEADRTNLGPGFRIGHSFFTPTDVVAEPEAWYRRIVETEVHPLLEEYWFDAPETADQWRDQLLS